MALFSPNDADAERSSRDGKPASTSVHNLTKADSAQPGSSAFSGPLETSVPLEAPRMVYRVPLNPSVTAATAHQRAVQPAAQPVVERLSDPNTPITLEHSDRHATASPPEAALELQSGVAAQVVDEAMIPLLEERLVIDRRRRKVGEVVVRKEIETQIVEVPIRREKLIVEQISPTYKQLAVVALGQTQADEVNAAAASLSQTANAKFTSANAAIEFIEAIAADSNSNMTAIQVSIVLVDENLQTAYHQWLEQHSKAT